MFQCAKNPCSNSAESLQKFRWNFQTNFCINPFPNNPIYELLMMSPSRPYLGALLNFSAAQAFRQSSTPTSHSAKVSANRLHPGSKPYLLMKHLNTYLSNIPSVIIDSVNNWCIVFFPVLKPLACGRQSRCLGGTYKLPRGQKFRIKLSPLSIGFPQRRPLNLIKRPEFINSPGVPFTNHPACSL